ncbi:hypothetical protein ABZ805_07125 [Saccharopolyspora sp. NPDC047091]|uniref:hypothetical protein n=1 Tax=Saccharopolyspora sp. NPDC047091 TaxID=3155924 RepID=UPI0033FD47CD
MSGANDTELTITVRVPAELPDLNQQTCRALLAILVDITTNEAPERPREGGARDC